MVLSQAYANVRTILLKVAEFLTENDHHERAVLLLIKTKQIEEALEMCVAQNIPITEEMAENMTPQKPDNGIYEHT